MVLEDDNVFVMGCDNKYVWFSIVPPEVKGKLLALSM